MSAVEHGGQPGHKKAWLHKAANTITHHYFSNTLPAMERGYIRPRYHGYLFFQDHGGDPIHEYLQNKRDIKSTLITLENLYHQSLKKLEVNA